MALTKIRAEQISDIDFKQAVRVVATTNVTLTNGAVDTIDSVLLAVSDRVLVTAQSTASQNGLYRVSVLGTGANGTWVRSSDGDATGDMSAGMLVSVTEGTVYKDTQWQLTTDNPIVLATTSLVFAQTSSGGGSYTAGTGLTLTGSAFSVNVAQTQITSVGTLTALSVSGTVTGGNLTTAGAITGASVSVSGTVTGASVVGGVMTGTSVSTTGNITTTANVTGNYILGNGSQLTGIAGSYGNTEVAAFLPTYTGNLVALTGNITTTANVTGGNLIQGTTRVYKWTTGATAPTYPVAGDEWYNSSTDVLYKYIDDSVGSQWVDQSFPTSFGNITIAGTANITGTISGSGNLSVTGNISGNYILGSGNISLTGNVTGGNILTGGLISAAGNITGGNIITGGIVSATGNVTSGASLNTVNLSLSGNVLGNLLPSANITYNLGSTTQRWNTLFLAGNTIELGSQTIRSSESGVSIGPGNITSGNILTDGLISATGNITGGNLAIAGAITGASSSVSGIVTGASVVGGVITGTTVSTTGTVTGGNLSTAGAITGASSSVSGTVTGASVVGGVITGTSISVSGNVTGGNVNAGNITIAADLISSLGATLTIDPATIGNTGVVVINGNLQVNGTTTTINSNVVSTNDLTINFANNAINSSAANGGGIEIGPIGSPYLTWLYNNSANVFTSSGGISAVGIITGASVVGGVITGSSSSVTGIVTGASVVGGVITGTSVSVTGNITAGNLDTAGAITGASSSVSGIVTGASVVGGVITGTTVSTTGTVTGGNLATAGAITGASSSVSGIVTGASVVGGVITGTSVSVTGNVTSGNVNTGALSATGTGSTGGFTSTASGSAASPSIQVYGGGEMGFYRITTNQLGIAAGGVLAATVTSAGLAVTGTLSATGTLSGGTSGTAYSFSGSAPAGSLSLISGGRFGIGMSLPTSKLTIGNDSFTAAASNTTGMYTGANGLIILSDGLFIATRAGVDRVILDTSGNLGLGGVTPSAWESTQGSRAIQFTGSAVYGYRDTNLLLTQNAYFDGGFKYYASSIAAGYYGIGSGIHAWFNAPSGTAGNAITFTQAMTLDASGNLGIGTSGESMRLAMTGTVADSTYPLIKGTVRAPYSGGWGSLAPETTIGGYQLFTFRTDNGEVNKSSAIEVYLANNTFGAGQTGMRFITGGYNSSNGSEAMRITEAGNVGIGTTSPSARLNINLDNATAYANTAPNITNCTAAFTNASGHTAGGTFVGYQLNISGNSQNRISYIGAISDSTSNQGLGLVFGTNTAAGDRSEKMRLDSAGNLGLGVTPSAWSAGTAFELNTKGNGLWATSTATVIGNNYYYNSGYKYADNGYASYILQSSGAFGFNIAPNNTSGAGASATFTQAMTLDASGNLGIGTSSITTGRAAIWGNGNGVANITTNANSQLHIVTTDTTVSANNAARITFNAGNSTVAFAKIEALRDGLDTFQIFNTASIGSLVFGTNDTERMRIDSSGNLGIGTSSPAAKLDILNTNATYSLSQRIFNASAGQFWIGQSPAATFLSVDNFAMAFCTNSNGGVAGTSIPTNERMRLDSAGNLGLGVTPSAWRTAGSEKVFQIDTGSLYCNSSNDVYLNNNWFLNSSAQLIYLESDYATSYSQQNGQHVWFNAASGTAGNVFSFTQAMTLDASGNLGIGTTSPGAAQLVIKGDGAVSQIRMQASTNTNQGLSFIYNYSSQFGQINCDEAGVNQLDLWYTALNHKFGRNTSSANVTFDSSGNVVLGSSANGGQAMTTLQGYTPNSANGSYGNLLFSANTNYTGGAGRYLLTNALDYTNFAIICSADATTTPTLNSSGAVSSGTAAFVIKTNATAIFTSVVSVGGATPSTSGAGITFPATQSASSDANTLDDYEEGTFTPTVYADSGSGVTYNGQSGKYTKIGNVVHYAYVLSLTSKGTMSGSLYLAGLPFEVETGYSGSAEPWGLSISHVQGLATNVVSINGWSNNASTIVQLRKQTAAATSFGSSYLDVADISDSFYIQFSGTYRAA